MGGCVVGGLSDPTSAARTPGHPHTRTEAGQGRHMTEGYEGRREDGKEARQGKGRDGKEKHGEKRNKRAIKVTDASPRCTLPEKKEESCFNITKTRIIRKHQSVVRKIIL